MKKLIFLFLFVLLSSVAYGQARKLTDGNVITFDYGTAGVIIPKIVITKSLSIDAPTTADTNKHQFIFGGLTQITEVACSTRGAGSTVTIQFDERVRTTPNTAGTNTLTSSLVCDDNEQSTTSFNDASIAAKAPLNLQIIAVSGTPGAVSIHITGLE